MELWYLYNSGFALRTEHHFLVFDYYLDCLPGHLEDGCINPELLREELHGEKPVVFVSHSHSDHYNHCIFRWREQFPDITYIVADEIPTFRFPEDADIHRMAPHQKLELPGLTVETLDSTDLGVAFLVQTDGKTIYHAGDLNWWHWNDEPAAANREMARKFQGEMERLAGRHIDLAMVTADPRQEENALLGMTWFMDHVGADHVVPMHFASDPTALFRRLRSMPQVQDGSWPVTLPGRRGARMTF